MKTRTLLVLALGCGVAIMVAGAALLVRLSRQDSPDPPVALGAAVTVGDMSVTVLGATERDGALAVDVVLGGVDDLDGGGGFRLIAAGRAVRPTEPSGAGECGATEVVPASCVVRFDVSGADGESRVLFYERGDEQVRWVLA